MIMIGDRLVNLLGSSLGCEASNDRRWFGSCTSGGEASTILIGSLDRASLLVMFLGDQTGSWSITSMLEL